MDNGIDLQHDPDMKGQELELAAAILGLEAGIHDITGRPQSLRQPRPQHDLRSRSRGG